MKNIFYAVLIFSLFNSCKSNSKQETKDTTVAKTDHQQSEKLIQKFKPIIQGVWVKKDYIDEIIKTKSVLSAMDEANDIITIDIDMSNIKGDSLIALTGNSHEGSQFTIDFQQGKTPETIKISEGGELGYSFENGDTILFFTRYDDTEKKSITTKFVKSLNSLPNGDLASGIDFLINKSLVSGNYTMTDTTGSATKVTFTNDGKVYGFLNHSKYEINFDLNSDPMDNLDEIGFDIRKKSHDSFSYKINVDTLSFYDTHPNVDSTELILGKRLYKFVRQK